MNFRVRDINSGEVLSLDAIHDYAVAVATAAECENHDTEPEVMVEVQLDDGTWVQDSNQSRRLLGYV